MAKNAPTEEKTEQPKEAPSAQLFTLAELAKMNGHTFHKLGKDGELYPAVPSHDSVFKATHLQADALHGWSKHEHHTSELVRLSGEDYVAAIEAAKMGKTHAPANKRSADEAAKKQASRDAAKKGA
jgi:hypothetical protein